MTTVSPLSLQPAVSFTLNQYTPDLVEELLQLVSRWSVRDVPSFIRSTNRYQIYPHYALTRRP
jgi:hypothetical protein